MSQQEGALAPRLPIPEPAGPGPARRLGAFLARWAPLVTLAVAAGALLLHLAYYARLIGFDPVDDAYISFRYALNWAHGYGPVFNPGERVEGYTNFFWTAILALAGWLGLNMPPLSLLLGAAAALATLVLLWRVAAHDAGPAAPFAALLLAADGSAALWAVSGMETALFALLVLGGAVSFSRELRRGGFPWSGVLFALAAMTRPEGALVCGLSVAYALAWRLAFQQRPLTRTDAGRIALFAALYGGYFYWRYSYYGFLLPNTFYAKVEMANPDAQMARGAAHLQTFLRLRYGAVLPILMALPLAAQFLAWAGRLQARRAGVAKGVALQLHLPRGYAALVVAAYTGYIVYVGGDWSIGRFFVPILPFAYLLAAEGVGELLHLAGRLLGARRQVPVWAMLLVAGLVALPYAYRCSYRGERELYALPFEVRLASQARQAAGLWLRDHADPGALLLVDAAGQMPYYSGLRAIDLFGLTDPYVAHKRVTIGKGTAGHEKVDLDYLFAQKPDWIVIYGRAFDGFPDLYRRVDGWTSDKSFARFLSVYRRVQ